ncbi:hypothetical protein COO60DRAFT_1550783 [Scenedesmus sp. NREL 46B-D3]|nr:hypothetical protein COO60DRAFT_1550783 [Scenedesmus sp. NREL 46B-D3]
MTDGKSTMQALRPKEHACATNLSTLCSAALQASWPVGSSGQWIGVLAVLLPSLRNAHAVHQFNVPLSHIGAVCVASNTCMHAYIHTLTYIRTVLLAGEKLALSSSTWLPSSMQPPARLPPRHADSCHRLGACNTRTAEKTHGRITHSSGKTRPNATKNCCHQKLHGSNAWHTPDGRAQLQRQHSGESRVWWRDGAARAPLVPRKAPPAASACVGPCHVKTCWAADTKPLPSPMSQTLAIPHAA